MLIITKFIGATNKKQSRVSARCYSRRIVVNWDWDLEAVENHHAAAKKLAEIVGMDGKWFYAETFDTSGNVYVRVPSGRSPAFKITSKGVK